MPLYEYACAQCSQKFSVLVGMTAVSDSALCPRCGASEAMRRVSRFARVRSEDEHLERLSSQGVDESDPRAMQRWAKEASSTMGEELGDDFNEYIEAASEAESPDAEF